MVVISSQSIPLNRSEKNLPNHEAMNIELTALAKIRAKDHYNQLIEYLQTHQDIIFRITESTLIAYRTGEEGWYRAFNATDPLVQKAMQVIKEDTKMALMQ